jgi:PAS domain S-box-containing protein
LIAWDHTLFRDHQGPALLVRQAWPDFAFLLAVLVLAGGWIWMISRKNRTLEEAQTALQAARDQSERQVQERTAELAHSLSLLNATLESTTDGILAVDLAGQVSCCNRRFAEMWGIPADLLHNKNAAELLAFATARTDRPDQAWLPPSPDADAPELIQLRDGRVFEESVHRQVIDNACVGMVVICRDITQRRRAETQLAYERDLLNTLMDHLPDAIYFKDRESRFLHYSRAFGQLFHLTDVDAMKGKTDADFFTEEHARQAYDDEQGIMRSGQPIIGKLEKETHPDGRVTWALTSKTPWRDKAGNIIGTFGISKDVTVIKEAEIKLEEASRQAGMAEVATTVLHNVGNVLNSVNTSISVIKEQTRSSQAADISRVASLIDQHCDDLPKFLSQENRAQQLLNYLKSLAQHLGSEKAVALRELQELAKNVDHIKDIVALQQNYAKFAGVTEMVKVTDLVEDALGMHARALARHDVNIVREYDPNIPRITLEKHKLLQVLVNLVHNAKYACDESGRLDKRLTLTVSHDVGKVRIDVADNGVGIPPENLTRIFNHGFTTRKNGHGFGLHSAALAVREMGGELLVQSDGPGRGATFTLELPLTGHGRTSVNTLPEPERPPALPAR